MADDRYGADGNACTPRCGKESYKSFLCVKAPPSSRGAYFLFKTEYFSLFDLHVLNPKITGQGLQTAGVSLEGVERNLYTSRVGKESCIFYIVLYCASFQRGAFYFDL
jgi:hypothetical protein